MKIKLTIAERFGIRNLLSEVYQKGGLTLETLISAQKIITDTNIEIEFGKADDKGVFKAVKGDEAVAVNLRQVVNANGSSQLLWDTDKDTENEYELSDKETNLLKEIIKSKSEKKELAISDNFIVELNEKLNA